MAVRKKKSLVIVESPAKAKTINKYLGDEFEVAASKGHVRDLPGKKFGIDIEKNAVHGSDAPETAKYEIGFFFSGAELAALGVQP